ncbi:protein FAM8A1 [Rhodnius prolixus]
MSSQEERDKTIPTFRRRTESAQEIRRRIATLPHFPFLRNDIPQKKYTTAEEYFKDLRAWMQQAYFWQSVTAAFPYYLMTQYAQQNSNQLFPIPNQFEAPVSGNQTEVLPEVPQVDRNTFPTNGIECRIPPFWKRIVAEFIDFLILFFLKLGVTYVAIDFFDIIDLDKFYIFHKEVKLEYKTILKMTEDIVILELVHRVVVCFFETFWLQGGANGRIGGASPGKSVMGLRVVKCDSVDRLENNGDVDDNGWVLVQPGTDLGLAASFLRAAVKNFVLALFIPTSLAFFYFAHGRTGYDVVCSTIVVQEPLRQPTRPVQPQL